MQKNTNLKHNFNTNVIQSCKSVTLIFRHQQHPKQICSRLTMSLVHTILTFQMKKKKKKKNISNELYAKTQPFFAKKNVRNFCLFGKKFLDFMHTGRLDESLTKDFVKLTML